MNFISKLHPLTSKSWLQCQLLSNDFKSSHLELSLKVPQLFLGFRSQAIGVAQLHLHLIEIPFHLLLDSQGIIPASHLSIQSALHGVCDSLGISLQLYNLFILFSQLSFHVSLKLVELQLYAEDLRFLMFQRCLKHIMIHFWSINLT